MRWLILCTVGLMYETNWLHVIELQWILYGNYWVKYFSQLNTWFIPPSLYDKAVMNKNKKNPLHSYYSEYFRGNFIVLFCFQFMGQDEMKSNVEQLARLQAGLEQARDDLEGINEEERLLEWEQSVFPQLNTMFQLKEPYDKLWNTAWSFHQKHENWMNGRHKIVLFCRVQYLSSFKFNPCAQRSVRGKVFISAVYSATAEIILLSLTWLSCVFVFRNLSSALIGFG